MSCQSDPAIRRSADVGAVPAPACFSEAVLGRGRSTLLELMLGTWLGPAADCRDCASPGDDATAPHGNRGCCWGLSPVECSLSGPDRVPVADAEEEPAPVSERSDRRGLCGRLDEISGSAGPVEC